MGLGPRTSFFFFLADVFPSLSFSCAGCSVSYFLQADFFGSHNAGFGLLVDYFFSLCFEQSLHPVK